MILQAILRRWHWFLALILAVLYTGWRYVPIWTGYHTTALILSALCAIILAVALEYLGQFDEFKVIISSRRKRYDSYDHGHSRSGGFVLRDRATSPPEAPPPYQEAPLGGRV